LFTIHGPSLLIKICTLNQLITSKNDISAAFDRDNAHIGEYFGLVQNC